MYNIIKTTDLLDLTHKQQVAFALFCAKQVIHLTKSKEVHRCIKIVELWLEDKATSEECNVVAVDAVNVIVVNAVAHAAFAATYVTRDTACAAAHATYAATCALAYDAENKQEILKQQYYFLYELKNIDKILEEELLS